MRDSIVVEGDGILLVAHGKRSYVEEACTCARSVRRFAPDVSLALATDLRVPERVWRSAGFTHCVSYDFSGCDGLTFKLRLDQISPYLGSTLFIDSDCICYGDLSGVFTSFAGQDFVTLGFPLRACHWFDKAEQICREFRIKEFPFFTGDFYLFRRSAMAQAVFAKARELEPQYDDLRIRRIGRLVNDEPLIALAMATEGIAACEHDGSWILQMQAQGLEFPKMNYLQANASATLAGKPIAPKLVHFQTHRSRPVYFREAWRVNCGRSGWLQSFASHCFGHLQSVRYRLARRLRTFWPQRQKASQ